ncbi:MAG: AAA family ATPase [Candidatus Aenigmarchaeota archaeon]|nr:AAA family ATPase [Candidatus Aenigmarchaeota archaeon]
MPNRKVELYNQAKALGLNPKYRASTIQSLQDMIANVNIIQVEEYIEETEPILAAEDVMLHVIENYFALNPSDKDEVDLYVEFMSDIVVIRRHYVFDMNKTIARNYYDNHLYHNFIIHSPKYFWDDGGIWRISEGQNINIDQYFEHQVYRDNETNNCLLLPILDEFKIMKESKKTKRKKAEIQRKINHVEGLMVKYNNGVPKDKIQEISDSLDISIIILDLLREEEFKFLQIHPIKSFKFINTRFNHVEIYFQDSRETTEMVNIKRFSEILEDLREKNEYHTYTHSRIFTLKKSYILDSLNFDEFEIMNKKCPLMDTIDYFDHPEFSKFIKESNHFCGTMNFIKEINKQLNLVIEMVKIKGISHVDMAKIKDIQHIDHIKSYANYKKCKYFDTYKFCKKPSVFMALPNDFPFKKYNGFFLIKNINRSNVSQNTILMLDLLKIYNNDNVFSTPELCFINDIGITFEIQAGAFSLEDGIDFDFSLLKIKNYAQWTGAQAQINLDKEYFIYADREIAQDLKFHHPEINATYVPAFHSISIITRKTHLSHRAHVSSYILAYSRIQILTQLFLIPNQNLLCIQLDGIYYIDPSKKSQVIKTFKTKKINPLAVRKCPNYFSSYSCNVKCPDYDENLLSNKILALGGGGCGKTHYFLKNSCLPDLIYVAPTNRLCREKSEEYDGIKSCTLAKFLGNGCFPERDHSNVVIDEASMIDEITMKNLIKIQQVKRITIIIAGDIGYQIKPYKMKTKNGANLAKNWKYNAKNLIQNLTDNGFITIKFEKNYRCKDANLLKLLNFTRNIIDEKLPLLESNRKIIDRYLALTGQENIITKKKIKKIKTKPKVSEEEELADLIDIIVGRKDFQPNDGQRQKKSKIYNEVILTKSKPVYSKEILRKASRIDDLIMSSTHERINDLQVLNLLIETEQKKWVISKTTIKHAKGDIVISQEKPNCACEERYIFTVHVCQGLTCTTNLYIDTYSLFEPEILYTALSRAQYLSQIFLFQ